METIKFLLEFIIINTSLEIQSSAYIDLFNGIKVLFMSVDLPLLKISTLIFIFGAMANIKFIKNLMNQDIRFEILESNN